MTDPIVRAAVIRYAVPLVIRRLRTRPLRAALLANLIRRRNR
ncbi:hypothetical protein ABT023_16310 [Micromonospora sp. NPDC002296]